MFYPTGICDDGAGRVDGALWVNALTVVDCFRLARNFVAAWHVLYFSLLMNTSTRMNSTRLRVCSQIVFPAVISIRVFVKFIIIDKMHFVCYFFFSFYYRKHTSGNNLRHQSGYRSR